MFPERLGVASTLQNPWTREEEPAWGWLGNLVHEGSDAARYWDPGLLLCGVPQACFLTCPLLEKGMCPQRQQFATPLMSVGEDRPV